MGVSASGTRPAIRVIDEAPAVRYVNALQARALALRASDVHVEPGPRGGRVRFRIDGILREIETVPVSLVASVTSRLKVIAGMDISDKRQPQDGRYTIESDGRTVDARVSTVPTVDGEKLVVRLLDRDATHPTLSTLGMTPDVLAAFRAAIHAPYGFVVVTGPTGSGKTTTLYGALAEIIAPERSVCSVEDPVELRVAGVAQVQVNPRAGLTFPAVVRAFLRQDPNVMMIGEMRDAETTSVALGAALSGSLVMTTLHASDAPRTVDRLIELGATRAALASALTAIVSQRLVRRLCVMCRREESVTADLAARFGFARAAIAVGCEACDLTGYAGRLGLFEVLPISAVTREAIASGASSARIGELGGVDGYAPMLADGARKVAAGLTTFDELRRVVVW